MAFKVRDSRLVKDRSATPGVSKGKVGGLDPHDVSVVAVALLEVEVFTSKYFGCNAAIKQLCFESTFCRF